MTSPECEKTAGKQVGEVKHRKRSGNRIEPKLLKGS